MPVCPFIKHHGIFTFVMGGYFFRVFLVQLGEAGVVLFLGQNVDHSLPYFRGSPQRKIDRIAAKFLMTSEAVGEGVIRAKADCIGASAEQVRAVQSLRSAFVHGQAVFARPVGAFSDALTEVNVCWIDFYAHNCYQSKVLHSKTGFPAAMHDLTKFLVRASETKHPPINIEKADIIEIKTIISCLFMFALPVG